MRTYGPLARETYKINGRPCIATVDFDAATVTIQSYGRRIECELSEYERFDGNMESFVRAKLNDR